MIDLIVQTLWTKPLTHTQKFRDGEFFGFKTEDDFLSSCYLSFVELRKKGYRIHLFTDNYGKDLLVNKLHLNYDYVSLLHEEKLLHPNLWAAAKLYTHMMQKEPYLHLDLDAFLIKDFTPEFKSAPIVCQNIESNYEFYKNMFNGLYPHIKGTSGIVEEINYRINTENEYCAMNVGIFGGNDMKTIFEYSSSAIEYLQKLVVGMPEDLLFYLCIFIEQLYGHYYFKHKGYTVKCFYDNPLLKFDDFLKWDEYVHLISSLKIDPKNIVEVKRLAVAEGYDS